MLFLRNADCFHTPRHDYIALVILVVIARRCLAHHRRLLMALAMTAQVRLMRLCEAFTLIRAINDDPYERWVEGLES